MSVKRHIYNKVVAALLAFGLSACQDARVYDHYEHTSAEEWECGDTLFFDVPQQQGGEFALDVGLRTTAAFPYRSLTLVVETSVFPSGETQRKRIWCTVHNEAESTGKQNGLSIAETMHRVGTLSLKQGDSLHVAIHHDMQREDLPGISEVGLRLSRK